MHAFGNPKDVITKELVSTIYDVDVEVNSLYGDKVRVCVPVREIERETQGNEVEERKILWEGPSQGTCPGRNACWS